MRNQRRLIDAEDARLTAGERRVLRQIALRLKAGGTAQPEVYNSLPRHNELEAEIAAIFTGGK